MEAELTLKDYVSILKRRYLYFLVPFIVIFSTSVVVSIVTSPIYQSMGVIMVEAQQIPDHLVKSTVTSFADERIEIITKRVMTRENLLRVMEKFNLYPSLKAKVPNSTLVKIMKDAVSIKIISANIQGKRKRGKTAIAFEVSFENGDPNIAYRVANEFVTLFLDENVRNRVARAVETTSFLRTETEKLRLELEVIEDQVASYKQENKDALPEHINLRLNQLERAITEQKGIDNEITAREEQARLLSIDLLTVKAGNTEGSTATSPHQELALLEAELIKKSASYGSSHPDIISLKRRISILKKEVSSFVEADVAEDDVIMNPFTAKIKTRIDVINKRIISLKTANKQSTRKIAQLEAKVIQTPQVERGLKNLQRGYESAVKKYEEIKSKLMSAQLSESLEENKKAERFTLLEPPVLESVPIKPNRRKIALMGFLAAFVVGAGAIFIAEQVNGNIYGSTRLIEILKGQPLVIIPFIETAGERQQLKKRIKIGAVIFGILLIVVLILIHFFYMPLDLVMFKILSRIS